MASIVTKACSTKACSGLTNKLNQIWLTCSTINYPQRHYNASTERFLLVSWHELRLRSRSFCSVFIKASWTRLSLPGRDRTRSSLSKPVRVAFTWFSDCRWRGSVSSVGFEVVRSSRGLSLWIVGTWLVEDACKCRRVDILGLFASASVFYFVFWMWWWSYCSCFPRTWTRPSSI